jgi:hypothetical protein
LGGVKRLLLAKLRSQSKLHQLNKMEIESRCITGPNQRGKGKVML